MLVLLLQSPVRAQELKIIDVRRNIPLSDTEAAYKDFYINGGTKEGLKPNLVVTAVRKTTIRDAAGLLSLGEIGIPVGQLRIIFVQDGLAVAREYKLLSRDELPMIEQIGIMGGDVLDLKGSFIEKRKPASIVPAAPPKEVSKAEIAPEAPVLEKTEEVPPKPLDYSAPAL